MTTTKNLTDLYVTQINEIASKSNLVIEAPANEIQEAVFIKLLNAVNHQAGLIRLATQYANSMADDSVRAINALNLGYLPSRASDATANYNEAVTRLDAAGQTTTSLLHLYVTVCK